MDTLPALSALLPVSTKSKHCLALPILYSSLPYRNFALRSHGVAASFSFKSLKAVPNQNENRRLRRVRYVEEEKTLVPEQVEDSQSSSQPDEQGEAVSSSSSSEQQSVSVPVSPSDSLFMFFQADGTMSEASIPAVTKALEGMEGISNLKVQVVEGIAGVEGSSQDEMKTKVVYAKVAASTPPVKAPVFSPPASSFKPPISAPPVKSPPSAKPPVYSPPPIITPMPPVRSKKDCVPLCHKRCQNHSRMNLCLRACNTCCDRCKCVPPGTYGNREICGKCYTEMTTRGNKPKCP